MPRKPTASTSRARDPRFTKIVGEAPFVGRRVVVDGRVRIEWKEGGRRRSKTIGANTKAMRARADEALGQILGTLALQPDQGGTMDEQNTSEAQDEQEVSEADVADAQEDEGSEDGYEEIRAVVDSVLDIGRRGALAVIELGDAAHEKLRNILSD